MFEGASWLKRAAIIVSVLWALIGLAIASSERDPLPSFIVLTLAPLTLLWGGYWVISGFLASRRKKAASQAEPGTETSSTPSSPQPESVPASVAMSGLMSRATPWAFGALVIAAGFTATTYLSSSARAGYLFGQWAVYSLMAYFVFRFLLSKAERTVLTPGIAAVVFLAGGMVGTVFYDRHKADQAMAYARAATPVLTAISRGEDIPVNSVDFASMGYFGPAVKEMVAAVSEVNSGTKVFLSETEGMANVLAPATLANASSRMAARDVMAKFARSLDTYEQVLNSYQSVGLSRVRTMAGQMPDEVRSRFIDGLNDTAGAVERHNREMIALQRELVTVANRIVAFADANPPTLQRTPVGDTLLFRDQATADRYNQLMGQVQKIADKETRLQTSLVEFQSKKVNRLEKLLSP